jgi:aquaporin Z
MFKSKVFVAELIGTFALTFIGAGAGIMDAGLVGVALAHGLTLAVFAYAYGHVSGTHVNPAVTFGLALNKTVTWGDAVVNYWLAQFLGAACAAGMLALTGQDLAGAATSGPLTANMFPALLVEAVLTFFLVNTVLNAAVAGKAGNMAGWAIGATLTFAILMGGSLTGASLNPARTFGPALYTGGLAQVSTYVVYFVGPLLGAGVAAFVYKFLNDGK